ncbi:SH3 domain-containing protein [Desulfopila sp. IMCC35006]|uniref:SH3 domain-containing protein n=1 Tax=Desulfopila sp. IMCC35006 TaxID=2569542 RepID=UPI0010ABAFC9|nr:SH3 domain-containing protein [Desulfopila sp. IMCC35006]TKB26210.1 SH3 domain-containing protein [Desulfopila sp. IMCC35006]
MLQVTNIAVMKRVAVCTCCKRFMLRNKQLSSNSLTVFLLFMVATLLFGCSSMKEAELLSQNNLLQEKNSQLAAELAEENVVTASLQMKLVEKQTEIDRIKVTQEHLAQEISQTKARKPAPKTRVEVVTYLAEVETDSNAAKERALDSEQPIFVQVDRFIAESKVELERGNDEAAYSRASQAMELTQTIQNKRALSKKMEESPYADFILPLNLHLAKRSNIRKEPSERGKVLGTLTPGTPVTASGSQGDWIKVMINNGQKGWIHYSLLAVPEKTLPVCKPVK